MTSEPDKDILAQIAADWMKDGSAFPDAAEIKVKHIFKSTDSDKVLAHALRVASEQKNYTLKKCVYHTIDNEEMKTKIKDDSKDFNYRIAKIINFRYADSGLNNTRLCLYRFKKIVKETTSWLLWKSNEITYRISYYEIAKKS